MQSLWNSIYDLKDCQKSLAFLGMYSKGSLWKGKVERKFDCNVCENQAAVKSLVVKHKVCYFKNANYAMIVKFEQFLKVIFWNPYTRIVGQILKCNQCEIEAAFQSDIRNP